MRNEEEKVKLTLERPKEIRQSKKDKSILLYYKEFESYHVCVVVKEGEIIWQK